jgi:hypothetical protein
VAHISRACCGRIQNGELDGYEAKLVVLHGVGITSRGGQLIGNIGDQLIGDRQAEFVAGYTRLIAEIRARQTQAKILILPPFPRGRLRREEWRTVADANAVAYITSDGDTRRLARSARPPSNDAGLLRSDHDGALGGSHFPTTDDNGHATERPSTFFDHRKERY